MFITHDVDEAVFLANRVVVMAARPGRIYDVIDVDLPYPRTEDVRLSPEFGELRNRVWHAVYHQKPPARSGPRAMTMPDIGPLRSCVPAAPRPAAGSPVAR